MPPILKKHRKNLIANFDFPEVKEADRFVVIKDENLLCNASMRFGFSEVSHFRCAKCRKDKPESQFENYGECKKCRSNLDNQAQSPS